MGEGPALHLYRHGVELCVPHPTISFYQQTLVFDGESLMNCTWSSRPGLQKDLRRLPSMISNTTWMISLKTRTPPMRLAIISKLNWACLIPLQKRSKVSERCFYGWIPVWVKRGNDGLIVLIPHLDFSIYRPQPSLPPTWEGMRYGLIFR